MDPPTPPSVADEASTGGTRYSGPVARSVVTTESLAAGTRRAVPRSEVLASSDPRRHAFGAVQPILEDFPSGVRYRPALPPRTHPAQTQRATRRPSTGSIRRGCAVRPGEWNLESRNHLPRAVRPSSPAAPTGSRPTRSGGGSSGRDPSGSWPRPPPLSIGCSSSSFNFSANLSPTRAVTTARNKELLGIFMHEAEASRSIALGGTETPSRFRSEW